MAITIQDFLDLGYSQYASEKIYASLGDAAKRWAPSILKKSDGTGVYDASAKQWDAISPANSLPQAEKTAAINEASLAFNEASATGLQQISDAAQVNKSRIQEISDLSLSAGVTSLTMPEGEANFTTNTFTSGGASYDINRGTPLLDQNGNVAAYKINSEFIPKENEWNGADSYNAAIDKYAITLPNGWMVVSANNYANIPAVTAKDQDAGGFGAIGSVFGAVIGIALAPVTGGTSLALAANGAIGGAVFNAITGGDPLEGAMIGAFVGGGASALGFGGAAAGEAAATTAATTAGTTTAAATPGLLGAPTLAGTTLTDSLIASSLAPTSGGALLTGGVVDAALAAVPTVTTGGALVGTGASSLFTGTGNSIIDGALNQALKSGLTNSGMALATGGDPIDAFASGATTGLVTGGVSTAINPIASDIASNLGATGTAADAITGGLTNAASNVAGALVNGGDLTNAAVTGIVSGATNPVVDSFIDNPALNNGVQGAINTATTAAVNGGDVLNAAMVGFGAGATGGLVSDTLGSGFASDIASTVAANTVGTILNDGNPIYTNPNTGTTVTPGAPSSPPIYGVDQYSSILNNNGASAMPANYFTGGSKASQMARNKQVGLLAGA